MKPGANHFVNIMRRQGRLDSKAAGFGDRALSYPAVARRQFIGGAITSDGCYDPVNHTIIFGQHTEEHFKCVQYHQCPATERLSFWVVHSVARDFSRYRVCTSLGIRATVHKSYIKANPQFACCWTQDGTLCYKDGRTRHPRNTVHLTGSGIERLLPYLIAGRK